MTRTPDSGHRVLIVEDHALVANTLADALQARGYEARHSPGADAQAVLATTREFQPTVVLLDLDLGGGRSGLPLIEGLRETGSRVVMLTASDDRTRLAECVEAGAEGVLAKADPLDEIVRALHEVIEHGSLLSASRREALVAGLDRHRREERARQQPFETLTRRERDVLVALAEGKGAQRIAQETFTSVRTVRGHIQSVLDKLGVRSQLAAVAKAREAGWLSE